MNILDHKRKLLARPGFLIGDKESKSSNDTTTSTTNNVTDNRAVADGDSILAAAGANVTRTSTSSTINNVTDLGAISKAFELAQAAMLGATKGATEQSTQASKLSGTAIEELKGAYESSGKQIGVYALIFVGGLVLFSGVFEGKK